ncbi:MAG: tRNA 2-selenouridine synthase [Saprospiraceae bacterium]|nr:MAG: tRNA 2-selenouridine synthase [Saprospiraceae bacterium]
MQQEIKVEQLFEEMQERILLDVRTPAEFDKGHIPGAINFPLFTNEERVEVGTVYKQESPEKALLLGLDLVGSKMSVFVREAGEIAPNRQLLIHCWRGGKRSESMGWLLDLAGFDVKILHGGYKAYRNYVLQAFTRLKPRLMVLGGYTGTGKTDILKALMDKGEAILDLEDLANHKGSSFGALGEAPQPSVEHFENILLTTLVNLPQDRLIWVEDESRSIGRVYLPTPFWDYFQTTPLIHLEMHLQDRVLRLVEEYGRFPIDYLKEAFQRIKKRLGGQNLKMAMEALDQGDLEAAATIALKYYDKAYDLSLKKRSDELVQRLKIMEDNPEIIAQELLNMVYHGNAH